MCRLHKPSQRYYDAVYDLWTHRLTMTQQMLTRFCSLNFRNQFCLCTVSWGFVMNRTQITRLQAHIRNGKMRAQVLFNSLKRHILDAHSKTYFLTIRLKSIHLKLTKHKLISGKWYQLSIVCCWLVVKNFKTFASWATPIFYWHQLLCMWNVFDVLLIFFVGIVYSI